MGLTYKLGNVIDAEDIQPGMIVSSDYWWDGYDKPTSTKLPEVSGIAKDFSDYEGKMYTPGREHDAIFFNWLDKGHESYEWKNGPTWYEVLPVHSVKV